MGYTYVRTRPERDVQFLMCCRVTICSVGVLPVIFDSSFYFTTHNPVMVFNSYFKLRRKILKWGHKIHVSGSRARKELRDYVQCQCVLEGEKINTGVSGWKRHLIMISRTWRSKSHWLGEIATPTATSRKMSAVGEEETGASSPPPQWPIKKDGYELMEVLGEPLGWL